MNTRLDPARNAWITAGPTRAVMAALTAKGGDARFVGGAVRNALLGQPVQDVDIATPLAPDAVVALLQAAGLKAVPTGIEHGTVTAVADGRPFEITTLRRDVSTDGRRAVVAFTGDWREDASRRDFTMNALYANTAGEVFDYFGGLADLEAGRVRFVGEASARIAEDYLRLLRLFRFHAWYGRGALDEAALSAAKAAKDGIKTLSGERVQKEMLRLLEAQDPIPVLRVMREARILPEFFPPQVDVGRADLKRLSNLLVLKRDHGIDTDPLLRLAELLLLQNKDNIREFSARWKLSNADRDRLSVLVGLSPLPADAPEARRRWYEEGETVFRERVLLTRAAIPHAAKDWRSFYDMTWTAPRFPLGGDDAMALGIAQGPRLGELLAATQAWWVDCDFTPSRDELLAHLKALAVS